MDRPLLGLTLLVMLIAIHGAVDADKCSDKCTCKWKNGKRTVECVERALRGIPEWIDPETQVLDASGNNITTLPSSIFARVRLTNLQRLYLRRCRIIGVDREAFTGLTNLVELDLSDNLLPGVPSASLANTPFLRDLVLSYNPIRRIRSNDFKDTPNLVKLDLSHAQLLEIEDKGFRGLESLESLKLNNNKLGTLHPGTFEPLNKLTSIELHDNPWICDCHLREMKMWLVKHNLPTLIAPMCHGPESLQNRLFTELGIDDFACRPMLMIASRYAEATIGENASIVCRVSAVPPAKIKWYWNGRLLTNHSAFSSYQKILIYEGGQFRKVSTLVLTNAQEADSSEFYCVAENRAGSVEANFTLHVSLRTAGMSTLGSGQIAGISAALVVLILFILLIILILFVRLRRMPLKDVKTTSGTGAEGQPGDGCATTETNQRPTMGSSGASTLSRRKHEEIESTSFSGDCKPTPVSLNLQYVQRPQTAIVEQTTSTSLHFQEQCQSSMSSRMMPISSACYSSMSSLMPIDNPDLIRDTRRGSTEDATTAAGTTAMPSVDYGRATELNEPGKIYTSCMWETRDSRGTSISLVGRYPSKEALPIVPSAGTVEQFPPGAKQMRVWQKGVPVLPPVSALKRVLGSTRSSPDEGYQEGTGTDV